MSAAGPAVAPLCRAPLPAARPAHHRPSSPRPTGEVATSAPDLGANKVLYSAGMVGHMGIGHLPDLQTCVLPCTSLTDFWTSWLSRRSLSDSAASQQQHETLRRISDETNTLQRLSNSSQVGYLSCSASFSGVPLDSCLANRYFLRLLLDSHHTTQASSRNQGGRAVHHALQLSAFTAAGINSSGSLSASGSLHRGSHSINSQVDVAAAGSVFGEWGAKRRRMDPFGVPASAAGTR